MHIEIAQQLGGELNEILGRMDNCIRLVMENGTSEELTAFRTAIGRVMGALVLDVLNPLYEQYPQAKPADFD